MKVKDEELSEREEHEKREFRDNEIVLIDFLGCLAFRAQLSAIHHLLSLLSSLFFPQPQNPQLSSISSHLIHIPLNTDSPLITKLTKNKKINPHSLLLI